MRLTLAQLQESINDFAGAKEQYDALYQAQKDQAHRLNALRCQFLAGEYDQALASFERFIANQKPDSPYRPIAAFLRAACLMQLQRFSDAAKGFAEAKRYGYDAATCYDQMIACYFESENYEKVVETGEQMIKQETDIIAPDVFYQKMGASLVQLEKYEEALDLLPKEQEATIRDFVSLCEAMSWRMLQIACSLMCFSNGSNTEHSAQTTESLTELSW